MKQLDVFGMISPKGDHDTVPVAVTKHHLSVFFPTRSHFVLPAPGAPMQNLKARSLSSSSYDILGQSRGFPLSFG
jgi:hypothetical protein